LLRFVGNLILSSSYEFYDDDITVTSFINIKFKDIATEIVRNEQRSVIVGRKKLMQIRFTLRRMQYMAQVLYEA